MIIQLKLKTPSFYNKTLLRHPVILRSLVATYRVIIDQNPSGILKSEPIGPGKWVVENFDSISSGLIDSVAKISVFLKCIVYLAKRLP